MLVAEAIICRVRCMNQSTCQPGHEERALAEALLDVRVHAGLTQEQLARRMDTSQSVIARLESGRTRPSTLTLKRLAAATGTRLRISFEEIT